MPYPERRKNEMRTFFRFEVEVEIERIESEISNFFLKRQIYSNYVSNFFFGNDRKLICKNSSKIEELKMVGFKKFQFSAISEKIS